MADTNHSSLPDPVRTGLAAGWKVIDLSTPGDATTLECDVAIVGSGAGGGVAAETLARAGLSVAIVEEGPLRSSSDFRMREAEAYPDLYQESAARKTADKAINILQGRCVGGGTTVNWTSSFRTPERTLLHWVRQHGLAAYTPESMAPWFEKMEARLSIAPWRVPPNENNAALAKGAQARGISSGTIRRNVEGCANLGYCGMGCPVNAKRAPLTVSIPEALARGATLLTRARAERLVLAGDRVAALEVRGMDASGTAPGTRRLTVRARAFVAAAGAIGTPGLLLRSGTPDPYGVVGKRTFLHPVVVSAAQVMLIHGDGTAYAVEQDARRAIDAFALAPLHTPVVSAHVMGGAPMGPDARRAVVDPSGRHHRVGNLFVADGSLFPTSIGANPQLSIYAIAARIADGIATDLLPAGAAAR